MKRTSKPMQIGHLTIGGDEPILIQSMLSHPWQDTQANLAQALTLEQAGCDILRVAVPTVESVSLIKELKKTVSMPIVADIHFHWKLALEALAAGADKIRINPGNIGSEERIKAVADACAERNVPIRIGINSGSVEQHILEKYGHPTAEAMVESALYHASLLEQFGFSNIAISIKSNVVADVLAANILLAEKTEYPIHLGVTHAGTPHLGLLKSSMGIGALLAMGIGDTFRVSLTASPVEEIKAAKDILQAAGLGENIDIVSCPTCGRAAVDVQSLTRKVEQVLAPYKAPLTVAVMGCVVNGPGEAKEADLGITGGGQGRWALFAKGEIVATLPEDEIIPALVAKVEQLLQERSL